MNSKNCRLPELFAALLTACALVTAAAAQQVADTSFNPPVARPAYGPGRGPVVIVDEAHHNFHTATGRYLPFAQLLGRDGYVVRGSAEPFTRKSLGRAGVLVVSNAPAAARNAQFLLNLMHWLTGRLG